MAQQIKPAYATYVLEYYWNFSNCLFNIANIMTQQEIQEEILKCQESPYYFATKYLKIENHKREKVPFTTPLSEEEFNKMFKELQNGTTRNTRT